jgi:hypothetical protein
MFVLKNTGLAGCVSSAGAMAVLGSIEERTQTWQWAVMRRYAAKTYNY